MTTDSIVCWVFDEHFAMHYVKIGNPVTGNQSVTMTANVAATCAGSMLAVTSNVSGTYASTNVFALELSDLNGNFNNPVILATQTGSTMTALSGTIPSTVVTGSNYKVRISTSNPVSQSSRSLAFSITALSNVSINGLASNYLSTATALSLTGSPASGTFRINGTLATQFNPSALGAGTHTVTYEVTQGSCSTSARQLVTVSVAMSATASVASGSVCAGNALNVTYNVSGVFESNNVFTIELSNETGSFTNPTVIGTVQSVGTANCILPQNLLAGNQYRVRVVATAPTFVGANSGLLTLQAAPLVNVGLNVSPANAICANDAVTFTATPTNGGTAPQYTWKLNGATVGTNTFRYQTSALRDGDVVYVEMGTPAVSTPVNMSVTSVVVPQILAIDSTLASNATQGNQWFRNGAAIQGATAQFLTTNVRGFYTVVVTQNGCSATSDVFSYTPATSTNDLQMVDYQVNVYPN